MRYGERAALARKSVGMSQAAVAKAIGKSRPWVGLVETGRIKQVSDDDKRAMSAVLGLPVDGLRLSDETLEEMMVRSAERGAKLVLMRLSTSGG